MLSSVLRSRRAVETNIAIMRAFTRLREALERAPGADPRVERFKRWVVERFRKQGKFNRAILGALQALTAPPTRAPKRIGF